MPELRVGYGERIITPPLGVELVGYGYYLKRTAKTVLDDLKARVLLVKLGNESIILISCDLLSMSVDYADLIRRRIASRQCIAMENILLACTHTHSGPAVQNLPALGEIDADYINSLPEAIAEAVEYAEDDLSAADLSCCVREVEPIGFNRRNMSSQPVDSVLRGLFFKRRYDKVYLLNYACHPVVLGPVNSISSDWPGALISALENKGHKGIFFQGFCGDIDPVCNLQQWGSGNKETMDDYGRSLCHDVLELEKDAALLAVTKLKALERRLTLRLSIPAKPILEQDIRFWMQRSTGLADKRFITEWAGCAEDNYDRLKNRPYLSDVPIQAFFIGPIKMLCLPGEAFCSYGLQLRKEAMFTVGYANGNIGYLPTHDAYADVGDYACYGSPKFLNLFPYTEEIEKALIGASLAVLSE
ncbi:MAG: neutral/alkaline non-lysosomal ceramidase N-terminal domain-containing protein [bacterium]|nr:neutral/alkaline non-lysosomal ceramidase N-terminal domain-containing protein [bacterium]